MRVLVVSHSCIVHRNRSKFIKLTQYSDIEIALLVPKYFRDDMSPTKKFKPDYNLSLPIKIYPLYPLLGNIPNKSISLHFYPNCKSIISQFAPDIIHIEEEPWSLSAFQFVITKGRAKFLFFTEQNLFKRYPPPFCWFEQYVYRKSNCAITVSETAKAVLINKGYNKEIFVVPHEVDARVFQPMEGTRNKLRKNLNLKGFVIGYAGRLVKEKGIHILLKAASSLKSKNVSLLLIGSGPLSDEIQSYRDELTINVIENIAHSEVGKYLNCMDVLVLPSLTMTNWKEQFGRVLIEAMACKVPVIGSSSGEIPTTIGDAGLVFKEGDVGELKDKLSMLINSKELRNKLAEKGYERAVQKFSLEKVASQIYEAYRWVMSNG